MRRVGSCRLRLELALDGASDAFLDPIVVDPDEKARSLVRLDYVRRWAGIHLLPIPMMFPEGGPPIDMRLLSGPIEALARHVDAAPRAAIRDVFVSPEATPAVRARSRTKSATSEYIRATELLEIVPFSRATLWRMFGLLPHFAAEEKYGKRTYNARSETVHKLPSFRPAWEAQQRCIVPAESVFEPNYETGKAVRWRISQEADIPFGIAGLYRRWRDPKGGPPIFTFTMLTVNADTHPFYKRFHKPGEEKRMPIFLDRKSTVRGCSAI